MKIIKRLSGVFIFFTGVILFFPLLILFGQKKAEKIMDYGGNLIQTD